jgi:hypothetical protein
LEAQVPFLEDDDLFSGHVGWNLTKPWPSDRFQQNGPFCVPPRASQGSAIIADFTAQNSLFTFNPTAESRSVMGEGKTYPSADYSYHPWLPELTLQAESGRQAFFDNGGCHLDIEDCAGGDQDN